ncbi:MAG: RidA family protein [Parvularculales bacterium]
MGNTEAKSPISMRISTGYPLEEKAGYSRAVVVPDAGGDWIFVSGTTGYDYTTMTIAPDVAEQARQCFRNIEDALGKAGASLEHVVRLRTLLTDSADFERIVPILADYMGNARPPNTAMIVGLIGPSMLIEIEALARKPAA